MKRVLLGVALLVIIWILWIKGVFTWFSGQTAQENRPAPPVVATAPQAHVSGEASIPTAACPSGDFRIRMFIWEAKAHNVSKHIKDVHGVSHNITARQHIAETKKSGTARDPHRSDAFSRSYGALLFAEAKAGRLKESTKAFTVVFHQLKGGGVIREIGRVHVGAKHPPVDVAIPSFEEGDTIMATITGGAVSTPLSPLFARKSEWGKCKGAMHGIAAS